MGSARRGGHDRDSRVGDQLRRIVAEGAGVRRTEHAVLQVHCDGGITGVHAHRQPWSRDLITIDDFSPNSLAYGASGAVDSKVSFTCEGSIPSDGVNCNAGGSPLPAAESVEGTFDTTDPYCRSVPTEATRKAKANASSKAEPQALVQLIVSDLIGAEDGPSSLNLGPGMQGADGAKKSVK